MSNRFFTRAGLSAASFALLPFVHAQPLEAGGSITNAPKVQSCSKLFPKLSSLKADKDKFETTEGYEARLLEMASREVQPGLQLGDTIAIKMGGLGRTRFSYDADRQTAVIERGLGPGVLLINDKLAKVVIADQKQVKSRTTKGSNAYGVTRTITIDAYKACGIAPTNIDASHFDSVSFYLSGLPPDLARKADGNLEILLIGKLVAPYASKTSFYDGATLSSPTEVSWDIDVLPMHVDRSVVYDGKSGTIIGVRELN
ncbi:hypothetical protein [Comamonas sp.]|uniref:hypothetical protein n=1 Tax=Comamonas sp. TaxID=34028 RepID=UPI0028A68F57|nr:hypothetical protein [Comamonas sp.]